MAATANYNLTLLEVGQKEKEATINTNMTTIDTALGTHNTQIGAIVAQLPTYTVDTTNNTATELVLPNLANDSTYDFTGVITARNTATDTESKSFKIEFLVRRGAAAVNTALIGSPTTTARFSDTGTSGWSVAVTADTTNGKAKINVTGETSKTIRWVATFQVTKVTG